MLVMQFCYGESAFCDNLWAEGAVKKVVASGCLSAFGGTPRSLMREGLGERGFLFALRFPLWEARPELSYPTGNAACCGLTTREPGQFPGSFLAVPPIHRSQTS